MNSYCTPYSSTNNGPQVVRWENYIFIQKNRGNCFSEELYNLSKDPDMDINLARSAAYAGLIRKLTGNMVSA